jgi:hypothetical protein
VLSSDEEETDLKNIPSSSAAVPRRTVKRVSSDLDSTFFEHQPAKKPKKKVSVYFSCFELYFINDIYFCRKNQDFFFLKPVSRVTTLAMMILLKWIIMMLVSSKNIQRKLASSNFLSIFLDFVTINYFISMQAEYLRSIRSPPIPSKFKVPVPKQPRKSELSHLSNLEEEDESYAEVNKIYLSKKIRFHY